MSSSGSGQSSVDPSPTVSKRTTPRTKSFEFDDLPRVSRRNRYKNVKRTPLFPQKKRPKSSPRSEPEAEEEVLRVLATSSCQA